MKRRSLFQSLVALVTGVPVAKAAAAAPVIKPCFIKHKYDVPRWDFVDGQWVRRDFTASNGEPNPAYKSAAYEGPITFIP